VQDSRQDWQQESSQMHLTYANAEFTIAATAATTSSDGLFFDPDPKFIRPCMVEAGFEGLPRETHVLLDETRNQGIESAPLNRRAWVQQERLLSRRTLHFAKAQVMWECRSLLASEAYPHRSPQAPAFGQPIFHAPPKIWRRSTDAENRAQDTAASVWSRALSDHASKDLSLDSDRLPAIAGLAKTVSADFNNERYVAGMWERDLIIPLAWTQGRDKPQRTSVAPSWLWLGWKGSHPASSLATG